MLGLYVDELAALCQKHNLPRFRARQISEWVFQKYVGSFAEMTNLPAAQREEFEKQYAITDSLVEKAVKTDDGTVKLLIKLGDGSLIETVLMEYRNWTTICLSSQVGCAMGCAFCASGPLGVQRNLSHEELVEQLWHCFHYSSVHNLKPLRNLVLMGIGEPLANYDNVLSLIKTANDPKFFGIGQRRITLSTAGIIPKIQRLAREQLGITLAVSLHAANDRLRSTLMPLNSRYPLKDLVATCRNYTEITGRRVTYEYMVLDGINDSDADARELALLLRGENCLINLIMYHKVPGTNFRPSPRIEQFRDKLTERGLNVTIRRSLG
ncbi:MAG: 23S rRNA (adenine(2503)-C(2))-methyltransferase RlmN [Firmicutes bacterium]|nr:23S rRNA (adenine(2503)-C(2))-methyltransferase RlmN [Bacillota bacterium]